MTAQLLRTKILLDNLKIDYQLSRNPHGANVTNGNCYLSRPRGVEILIDLKNSSSWTSFVSFLYALQILIIKFHSLLVKDQYKHRERGFHRWFNPDFSECGPFPLKPHCACRTHKMVTSSVRIKLLPTFILCACRSATLQE